MAVRASSLGSSKRIRQTRSAFRGIFLCLLLGIGTLIGIRLQPKPLPPAPAQPIVAEFESIKVPVPVALVPAGTKLKDVRFRTVAFPKHQVPHEALLSLEPYTEAVAVAALPANLPLFKGNLSLTAHASNPVLERIPPGMRAMTIRVDATSAVEGWAGSGSIVDVLLVAKDKTVVIAEKVKVLSAERSVSPVEGASAPSVPSTVTLLVTQEQCLAINTAIPLGKIAFALRSTRDEENWTDTMYTKDRLKGGSADTTEARSTVTGYVSIQGDDQSEKSKAFALANGRWIRTESVPDGFLVATKR